MTRHEAGRARPTWLLVTTGLVVALVAVAILLTRDTSVEVLVIEARDGDVVALIVERCNAGPELTAFEVDDRRLEVEVRSGRTTDQDCLDLIEVDLSGVDVDELRDRTSGRVFDLHVCRANLRLPCEARR